MAGTKLDIEYDDPYQLARAIADYYRIHRWKEFVDLSNKYMNGKQTEVQRCPLNKIYGWSNTPDRELMDTP